MPTAAASQDPAAHGDHQWRLVIHGGSGMLDRGRLSADQDQLARAGLAAALAAGGELLESGGGALDAVEAAVRLLEDDPVFNAGRGAVFTYEGEIEHDAAIMGGAQRRAGAAAGTSCTRHPISLARRIMESSPHVMLRGAGADQFSREQGLEQVTREWFHTPERRRQWEEFRRRPEEDAFDIDLKYGTVGAVALDTHGHVAAATSTGGLTGKRWGRIGDSPIIGAGTYADDRAGAVSATGAGEFFIREGVAHEICARLRFTDDTAQEAADTVMREMQALGGTGGVILVTPRSEAVYSFTTPGMYRGQASAAGHSVGIYGDE